MKNTLLHASPSNIRILSILTLLLLVGGFLRFYDLGTQPYWMDEGYTINAILAISEKGESVLDSGLPYGCPMYCYPATYIADTFGHTATSYRLPAAVMGVLFILLIYVVVRRLFDTPTALLTTAFTTFSYFHIAWSRQARWYTLFTFLFWLSLYTFYRAYYGKEKRFLFGALTVLLTILTILTHGLGYLLPFIMICWIAIDQLFTHRHLIWRTLFLSAISIAGVIVLLDVFLGKDTFLYSLTHFELYASLPFYLSFYLRTYWLFIPFVLIALLFPPLTYRRPIYLLSLTFLAYLLPLSFLTSIIHYRYLFHLTPIIFMLATIGMLVSYRLLSNWFFKTSFVVGILLLFFTVGTGIFIPQSFYRLESDNPATSRTFPGTAGYYAYTPQPNWNSAYAYIKEIRTQDDIIISSHPHFTKIFLREAGYWLGYNYHGMSNLPTTIKNDREYYVGAIVVDNLEDFVHITEGKQGFVILDYMATDNRIAEETLTHIRRKLNLVYQDKESEFSQIWIYRFEHHLPE